MIPLSMAPKCISTFISFYCLKVWGILTINCSIVQFVNFCIFYCHHCEGVGHLDHPLLCWRSCKRPISAKVSARGGRSSSDGWRLHPKQVDDDVPFTHYICKICHQILLPTKCSIFPPKTQFLRPV